jgi:hypothetical protein
MIATIAAMLEPAGELFVPPPIHLTKAEGQAMGLTIPAAPPPPGVSTALVALCTCGCLLTVLLFVRGEQILALFK